jgi:Mrp family chromosome partitioning ATPase
MTVLLLAVPGLAQEPELVLAAPARGVQVRRRCVDAADLLAAAATDPTAAIVVSNGLPRLSPDAVERLASGGRRLVGLAADREDADRLRAMGVVDVVVVGPTPSATMEQLAAVCADSPQQQVPPVGVWSTGVWSESTDPAPEETPRDRGSIVAVWGPMGAPGRTTVAVGLAESFAEAGRRTCLVDADTYAPSVAMSLGIVEEASGLVVACRHADNGSLTPSVLGGLVRQVRPGWAVLGGLSRPDRWADLRAGALDRLWSACREAFDVTVVDVGFCLEADEAAGPWSRQRNAAALTALAAADTVVAVGDASASGAARLVHSWPDLGERAPAARLALVRNRAGGHGREWVDAVRSAGLPAPVRTVPRDDRAVASCWARGRSLGEGARRSRIRRALRELATDLVGG